MVTNSHKNSRPGCDASILLKREGSARGASSSKSLRGFEVIDDIKAEVEKACPYTVSCTNIITTAARDATLKIGDPFWHVPFGRKDGLVSVAKEAEMVPMGHENVTSLIKFFQSRGLSLLDLVILSGTVHSLHKLEVIMLTKISPSFSIWASEYVDVDGTTPKTFDSTYYTNLQKKMGLLSTDQLLYSDSRTAPIVTALATQPWLFYRQFAVSMVNLGKTQILTGSDEGEIRTNCNFVNH
ncbi:peroxidase 7 isoform X4 [Cinnamomum micranthum f. kanehirae]|uniref:Peroxidase 7 isoform X4 n=1 Tax=Cinnamomum micranthum f. kanehirae TaxID=337451 RepID=A0A3S3N060_9MAGN|nr:peroxidase 7 isoform X4 [Cinnamomum micranthum f. kanehirae]